jgi:diguanylate cyclase (GGDEF)-like protein
MNSAALDDVRASAPTERLLEDSWEARSRSTNRRELVTEITAGALFLLCAGALALTSAPREAFDPGLAALLVVLYALVSRIEFPIGAGFAVPSYLVLVPMLLLLPPATVPLLTAAGLVLGAFGQWVARRGRADRMLFSIPDAWHALGPATMLVFAGSTSSGIDQTALVYIGAFAAGCIVDLVSAISREAGALGIAPRVQMQVIAIVWVVDACLAPVGLLVANAARDEPAQALMILPLSALLVLLARDRSARIVQAQHRLELVGRERNRLQGAVRRLGDAFAAKLDLDALTEIVLRGSVEALDADGGQLTLDGPDRARKIDVDATSAIAPALETAGAAIDPAAKARQVEWGGVWALGVPIGFPTATKQVRGVVTVARKARAFRDDEVALLSGLVERARRAAADIAAHQFLREQAFTDPLTRLGNRRKLAADLDEQLRAASNDAPLVLMLLDLDGFKGYNDTFGHLAGDALLARLGAKLATAVEPSGVAYRLGGDEFCVLLAAAPAKLEPLVATAADALCEAGEGFKVTASYGAVLLPHEATDADYALQLADKRMYATKRGRSSGAGEQARDVLMGILQTRQPNLHGHSCDVAELALLVGRRLGMGPEELDEVTRAAELHDLGKIGIPDAILEKPAALDADEWDFIRQHTVLGERILSAAPALRPVGSIVRSTHERWDGRGYPDRLTGDQIPLGARIVAVCDAYEAMVSDRPYRRALEHLAACAELRREAGHQFDPEVVEAFMLEVERMRERRERERAAANPGLAPQADADAAVADVRELLERHYPAAAAAEPRPPRRG